MDKKNYSLCEAVADISFIAGEQKYYSGDSRKDISDFIEWAQEFEKINEGIEWGINTDKEYIDSITVFALSKMKTT